RRGAGRSRSLDSRTVPRFVLPRRSPFLAVANQRRRTYMRITEGFLATTMRQLALGAALAGSLAACDDSSPNEVGTTGVGGTTQNRCTNGSTGFAGANGTRTGAGGTSAGIAGNTGGGGTTVATGTAGTTGTGTGG